MERKPEGLSDQMSLFQERLRKSGVKLTHQRLEIFREIVRSQDHPDAMTIHRHVQKKLPTVSLDTVYRTLWMLVDLGLITTLGPPHRGVRFDANIRSHHHFICTECGAAQDFDSKEYDQLPVPATARHFGSVERIHVELSGLCSRCAQKKKLSMQHITRAKRDKNNQSQKDTHPRLRNAGEQ